MFLYLSLQIVLEYRVFILDLNGEFTGEVICESCSISMVIPWLTPMQSLFGYFKFNQPHRWFSAFNQSFFLNITILLFQSQVSACGKAHSSYSSLIILHHRYKSRKKLKNLSVIYQIVILDIIDIVDILDLIINMSF